VLMKRLSLVAVLAAPLLWTAPALAQNSNAVNSAKIEILERQVTMLRTRLGMNPVAPTDATAPAANPALLADLSAKVGNLESQLRRLNGRLEEFEHHQRQIQEDMVLLRKEIALQHEDMMRARNGVPSVTSPDTVDRVQPQSTLDAGIALSPGNDQLQATADAPADPVTVTLPEGDPASQYSYAFAFIQKNDLARGRLALDQFIAANAGDTRIGNAKYWLGRIHLQEGRNAAAAQQLLALIEEHPNHVKRTDALVDLADVLLKLDSAGDACDALAEFARVEEKASARLKARAERVRQSAGCD